MALPKDRSKINTNLTNLELDEICNALDSAYRSEVSFTPGIEFAGYFECKFHWRGQQYRLNEEFELVTSIWRL